MEISSAGFVKLYAMESMDRLIQFMIRRREELRLSQRDLAKAAGMNPGTVSSIEAGKVTKSPSLETLDRLARGLRVTSDDLIAILRNTGPRSPEGVYAPQGLKNDVSGWRVQPNDSERAILDEADALGVLLDVRRPGLGDLDHDDPVRVMAFGSFRARIDWEKAIIRQQGKG